MLHVKLDKLVVREFGRNRVRVPWEMMLLQGVAAMKNVPEALDKRGFLAKAMTEWSKAHTVGETDIYENCTEANFDTFMAKASAADILRVKQLAPTITDGGYAAPPNDAANLAHDAHDMGRLGLYVGPGSNSISGSTLLTHADLATLKGEAEAEAESAFAAKLAEKVAEKDAEIKRLKEAGSKRNRRRRTPPPPSSSVTRPATTVGNSHGGSTSRKPGRTRSSAA